jgi:hypothetical protein
MVSKDDLDFIKLNKKLVTANPIVKRAPSTEMMNSLIQKRNQSFDDYDQYVKGRVPE